jgi:hypothetical protein
MTPGPSVERMAAVFDYLADELMRDAFPCEHAGRFELFLDAPKLKQRLIDAIKVHPEVRSASYEPHLARLTGDEPLRLKTASDFQ